MAPTPNVPSADGVAAVGTRATHRPIRHRRSRRAGAHLPEGVVYVGRPSKWGNPFQVGLVSGLTREVAVAEFRRWLLEHPEVAVDARRELAGRDLSCYCPLDEPCHADVLLELANAPACTSCAGFGCPACRWLGAAVGADW